VPAERARAAAEQPFRTPPQLRDASVTAFHWGMGVGGALVLAGGIVALLGIENPRRGAAARA
jgi:hypothetical protein